LNRTAIGAHIAVILLCGVVAVCAVELTNTVDRTLDGLNAALATVNRPKSGTLSMLDDTILQSRLTIDATNKVLLHEQTQLATFDGYGHQLDAELAELAGHADKTLDALNTTVDAAKVTLGTANTTIAASQPFLVQANSLVTHLDAQTVPDVNRFLETLPPVVANMQVVTAQAAIIATDAKIEEQKYTHPPKKKLTFWGAVEAAAGVVHKFEPPIF
jgi:ABC-type transporter Mla subunit MlaD